MPSSQKRTPFKRKVIIKAFFDLDLFNEPSTASKTLKLRNHNCLIAFKPSAIDEVKENNKVALLTLSVEIQLQIYDLLLVSWFDWTENPSWAVKHTDQKLVLLHMGQFQQYRTLKPEILQMWTDILTHHADWSCKLQVNKDTTYLSVMNGWTLFVTTTSLYISWESKWTTMYWACMRCELWIFLTPWVRCQEEGLEW